MVVNSNIFFIDLQFFGAVSLLHRLCVAIHSEFKLSNAPFFAVNLQVSNTGRYPNFIYLFIYLNIFIQGVYKLANMLLVKYVPCYTFNNTFLKDVIL